MTTVDIAGELVVGSVVMFIFSPTLLPSTWRYCTPGHRAWLGVCLLLFILASLVWGLHAMRALLHFT